MIWKYPSMGIIIEILPENGCVTVKDREGQTIHIEHLLELVNETIVAYHYERKFIGKIESSFDGPFINFHCPNCNTHLAMIHEEVALHVTLPSVCMCCGVHLK